MTQSQNQTLNRLQEDLERNDIPQHSREAIIQYILYGRGLGDFLRNVFSNKLVQSFSRADDINGKSLKNYAVFLYNCTPADCWGSEEIYKDWCFKGGLFGEKEK